MLPMKRLAGGAFIESHTLEDGNQTLSTSMRFPNVQKLQRDLYKYLWVFVISIGTLLLSPCYCPCLLAHSSGVKHFGVHACIAAISVFSAELTILCLARVFFFSN